MKVAVISKWVYDDALEWFFARAFERLGHEVVRSQTLVPGADLSLVVKAHWVHPDRLSGVKAHYFSDLTARFPADYKACNPERYDHVFLPHNEKDVVDGVRVHHLPVGYDPEWHRPLKAEQDIDVSFIGTRREERNWLLRIPNLRIHGSGWVNPPIYGDARRKVVARSKINLNSHYRGETENMRLYELLALGAFQLTDRPGPFRPALQVVTYHTPDEALLLIDRYLADPSRRAQVAYAGFLAVKPHTYDARMKQLLETVGL